MKIITRETMNDEIDKIKEQHGDDIKIYSISRLNNMNSCPRQYYHTYVDKKTQDENIYSILGSATHNILEDLYEGKIKEIDRTEFDKAWVKAQMFGIKFMSENVKKKYMKDMDVFFDTYRKKEGEFISELGFILKLDDKRYIIGYIDSIEMLGDNKVRVIDYKTSSKFSGKEKLKSAGRQLGIYQMALEQLYGFEVVENGWEMLKYLEVKIGSNKPKVVEGFEWVSKCKTQIRTLLKKKYMDSIIIDVMLAKCEAENSIQCLPDDIKDQIQVSTYFCKYDITHEIKEEITQYINETIKDIEGRNEEDERDWECSINPFFCENLCSYSKQHCKSWKNKR